MPTSTTPVAAAIVTGEDHVHAALVAVAEDRADPGATSVAREDPTSEARADHPAQAAQAAALVRLGPAALLARADLAAPADPVARGVMISVAGRGVAIEIAEETADLIVVHRSKSRCLKASRSTCFRIRQGSIR